MRDLPPWVVVGTGVVVVGAGVVVVGAGVVVVGAGVVVVGADVVVVGAGVVVVGSGVVVGAGVVVVDAEYKGDVINIIPAQKAGKIAFTAGLVNDTCLLYTSPSPRDVIGSRMPSAA